MVERYIEWHGAWNDLVHRRVVVAKMQLKISSQNAKSGSPPI